MARLREPLSRDEIVARGLAEAAFSENSHNNRQRCDQWLYKVKVRQCNGPVENLELSAWTIPHLRAILIMDLAEDSSALNATSIVRVMKARMRSPREDY